MKILLSVIGILSDMLLVNYSVLLKARQVYGDDSIKSLLQ